MSFTNRIKKFLNQLKMCDEFELFVSPYFRGEMRDFSLHLPLCRSGTLVLTQGGNYEIVSDFHISFRALSPSGHLGFSFLIQIINILR